MIYTGPAIHELIKADRLLISPFNKNQLQPASYDLRLSNKFMTASIAPRFADLDLERAEEILVTKEEASPFYFLESKGVVLCQSLEYIKLPQDVAAKVMDKSSLGRLFLNATGGNAGWVDPGFEGYIVLEIVNNNNFPIKLNAGMRICQLIFYHTIGLPVPYSGSYQTQRDFSTQKWKDNLVKLGNEAAAFV